jgi:hypothetical protein
MRTALLSTDAQLIALQTAMAQKNSCDSNAAAAAPAGSSDADGDVDMLSSQQQQQSLRYVKGDPFADEAPDLQAWAEAFPFLCVQGVSLQQQRQQQQHHGCMLGEDDCSAAADISSFQPESCLFQPVTAVDTATAAAAGTGTAMQVVGDSDHYQQQQHQHQRQQQHTSTAAEALAQHSSHSSSNTSSSVGSSDASTLAVIGSRCCIHQSREGDFGESQDGGNVEDIYATDGILEVSTAHHCICCSS